MLDEERARIKQAAHEDIDRSFALAFQDRDAAISAYADWFFEWKRSYVVLKETISSAITRFFEVGKYDSLNEAIEADVKDYFLRNYKEQVLKPELRDQTVTKGVEQAVRHAHDSYRRVIANGDMRLQLFLAQHTSHLEDIPASTPMTNVKLDWDAQKWKAPTYLMEDRAFDGIAGLRRRCRRRHGRARWRLAPRSTACSRRASGNCRAASRPRSARGLPSPSRGRLPARWSSRWAGRWSARRIGVAIGAAVDYLSNAANEAINRESFVAANEEALDATIATWKSGLEANIDTAIDKWFDDARASVVLASK